MKIRYFICCIIICYLINGSVDHPLQWYEIGPASFLLFLSLFVIYMLLIFMRGAYKSIVQLLRGRN